MKQLILGGARSGKSRFAEQQAVSSGRPKHYLATAQALDGEMDQRIQHHQQRRDESWVLVEEPIELADCLARNDDAGRVILVDCLTLWLTNCLCHPEADRVWPQQRSALLAAIPKLQADVIFVSNEVGLGVVPMDALSRRFVDEAGFLHQALAVQCDNVVLVTAGLPQNLKGLARQA